MKPTFKFAGFILDLAYFPSIFSLSFFLPECFLYNLPTPAHVRWHVRKKHEIKAK